MTYAGKLTISYIYLAKPELTEWADVHKFNRTKVKPLEIVYIYPIGKFTDDIKCGQRPLHENDEVTDFAEQGACLLALNNR